MIIKFNYLHKQLFYCTEQQKKRQKMNCLPKEYMCHQKFDLKKQKKIKQSITTKKQPNNHFHQLKNQETNF